MLNLEQLSQLIEIITDLREISRKLEYYNTLYTQRMLSPAEWAEVDELEETAKKTFKKLRNYIDSDLELVFTNNPLGNAILICAPYNKEIYI